jgi:preprotein translocase subunit SecA
VEGHHFDSRKHVLEYDQVLNRHRAVIYAKRRHILDLFDAQRTAGPEGTIDPSQIHLGGEEKPCTSLRAYILDLIETEIDFLIEYHTADPERPGELAQQSLWNLQELYETMRTIIMLSEKDKAFMMGFAQEKEGVTPEEAKQVLKTALITYTGKQYDAFEAHIQANLPEGKDPWQFMRELEKGVLLRAIDTLWVDHLVAIRYLRAGIGLRGYGQRDPLIEYKKETFHMFERLLSSIQKEVVYTFFKVGAGLQLAPSIMANDQMTKTGATDAAHSAQGTHAPKKERTEDGEKVGRNDLCPCGSGKKYKKCHGAE